MKIVYLPIILVSFGFALLFAAVTNVNEIYQLLNSSLDQAFIAEDGNPTNNLDLSSSADQNSDAFIPIYAPASAENVVMAPEIDQAQEETQKQSISDKQVEIPILVPERLVIESIGIDTSVVPVDHIEVEYLGEMYQQWRAPRDNQLGWHSSSARIGDLGNTVINGHSSGYGESFKDLDELKNGDIIYVFAENYRYTFQVTNTLIMKERWESIEVRMQNAAWISPSQDERLTLVSCWPNNSSTHRLIIVAVPLDIELIEMASSGEIEF